MSKKAIVILSFGTTVPETRKKTIDRFEQIVRERYPEYDVFNAFTSRIVVKRVREAEGIRIPTERGILFQLAADGYEEVILQPLHIIPGAEYHKALKLVHKWKKTKVFKRVTIGRPLLRFIGQEGERPDDYAMLLEAILGELQPAPGEGVLLIGHGTMHPAQPSYSALQLKARAMGYHHVWVGTIEGFPEWDLWLEEMKRAELAHVRVKPLFFVAGDHVQNDIFGAEDDAVANELRAHGFEVVEDHVALGEMESVWKLYLQHLDDIIAGRYMHRPAHRPKIPNVI